MEWWNDACLCVARRQGFEGILSIWNGLFNFLMKPRDVILTYKGGNYEPIYLRPDEMDSFRVIGKVVWISRDVK